MEIKGLPYVEEYIFHTGLVITLYAGRNGSEYTACFALYFGLFRTKEPNLNIRHF